MFVDWYRQKQHHNGPNYVVNLQEAWERRDHSLMWRLAAEAWREEKRPEADPAAQIGEVSCAAHVRMGDAKE